MGKRSDFERVERDYYRTIDDKAIKPLLYHLTYGIEFAEVCAGDGTLTDKLVNTKFINCTVEYDIEPTNLRVITKDALELTISDLRGADCIITNPPWSKEILHPLINHLRTLKPTYLLFYSDWAFTKQAREFLPYCSDIISVGRLKWIEGTKMTGKDNVAWYRFQKEKVEFTKFHGSR